MLHHELCTVHQSLKAKYGPTCVRWLLEVALRRTAGLATEGMRADCDFVLVEVRVSSAPADPGAEEE